MLVLELQAPVGGKPCSRRLPSYHFSLEPPESYSPSQSQSCACVLALPIVQYLTAPLTLAFPKGLGRASLPGYSLDSSYPSFHGSVVLLIKLCNACQKSGVLSGLSLRPRAWTLGLPEIRTVWPQSDLDTRIRGMQKLSLGVGVLERNCLVL